MKLQNKNAIITGGSRGLGKEIARSFFLEGASVAICARNGDELEAAYDELRGFAREGRTLFRDKADVSDESDVKRFVGRCADHFGKAGCFEKIDILVNNAGIHGSKNRIGDDGFDLDNWKNAINVNLLGTLHMCLAVVPFMKENGRGKIINLSGGGATSPMPGMSAYASSKAAVVRFTETIAIELQPYNIDVNAVAPGAMNTRLLDDVLDNGRGIVAEEYYQKLLEQKENGGTPPGLAAELCVYLASDESCGVTGKLISAVWDDWKNLHTRMDGLQPDAYTLRRVVP